MTSLRRQAPLDAVALGCRCSVCPFRDDAGKRLPVAASPATSETEAIMVLEGPGRDENTVGQVLVGATGRLLDGLLKLADLDKHKLYRTNATKCQPPWGATAGEFKAAVAACRPGLVVELATLPPVPIIAAGGLALEALTGHGAILEYIGVPLVAHEDFGSRATMPIVHPAAALPHRTPALGQVLVEHLRRARALVDGKFLLAPGPKRIITDRDGDEAILSAIKELWLAPSLGVDVETPMIKKPLDFYVKAKRLLNVGVASFKLSLAVCVTWYKASKVVKDAIMELLASAIPKRLQNGNFDARVFRVNKIVMNAWVLDTMDLFKLCFPGLPAGLDFIAAFLTLHERWKDQFRAGKRSKEGISGQEEDREAQAGEHSAAIGYLGEQIDLLGEGTSEAVAAATPSNGLLRAPRKAGDPVPSDDNGNRAGAGEEEAEEAEELDRFEGADETERAIYCGKDACHQDEIGDILLARLPFVFRGEERHAFRHACILEGVNMWERGMPISDEARKAHRVPLTADMAKYEREAIEAAKDLGWNEKQIVEFGRRDKASGVKQFRVDEVIFNPGSTHHMTKLLVHNYGMKPLAYTDKRAPKWDAEVLEFLCGNGDVRVRALARKVKRYKEVQKELGTYIEGLPVFSDGRIHSVWKPCHALSMQWSSEGPNAQNIPKHLRDLIAAALGMWLIECDFKQVELLIIALLSGDTEWLEIFAKGKDIHRANGAAMFGVKLADVTEKQRTASKPTVFCFAYNGSPKTAWAKLMESEDFKDVKLQAVEALHRSFFAEHPAIRKFHQECFADARNGRLVCDLSGHELVTWGYVDHNLDANFRVQTRSRYMTSRALLKVVGELRERGLVDYSIDAHQHDALWGSGPDPMVLAECIRRNMEHEQEYRGNKAMFKVDTKVSRTNMKAAIEMDADGNFKVPRSASGSSTLNGHRAVMGVYE